MVTIYTSSRTRFMMETLTNLKNNKVKKQQTAEGAGNEIVSRLQKFVKGIDKTRHGMIAFRTSNNIDHTIFAQC